MLLFDDFDARAQILHKNLKIYQIIAGIPPKLAIMTKLYIPSTLNTDYLLGHTHIRLCVAVNC